MKRTAHTAQPELFVEPTKLPREIEVGPHGVAERWLEQQLGIAPSSLHVHHSDTLGAPRDYRFNSGGYFYTPEGVRRVVKLLGLAGKIRVRELSAPPVTGKFGALQRLLKKSGGESR